MEIKRYQVSAFRRPISNHYPCGEVSLHGIYRYETGNRAVETQKTLRSFTDEKDQKQFKNWNFDWVTPSGTFSYASDDKLLTYSSCLCMDIDYLCQPSEIDEENGDPVTELREKLLVDPYFETLLLFRSPRGRGIIFSTEADTLSQALSQEWGQFTDSFRQAFHHESIESSRTKDKLRIIIEEPQLGILVTCTPQQIVEMLSPKQSENGTSSRDLFYCTKGHQEWIDPFQAKEPTADYYYEIGKDVKKMYDQLENRSKNRIQILISDEKRQAFNEHFCPLLPDHIGLYGEDFAAFTVRIALIAFRMMMILTTVRNFEKGNLSDPKQQAFVITDDDYETAMTIIDCLVEHTAYVYKNLLHPSDETLLTIQPLKGREQQFYLSLPDEFTTKVFNEKAEALGIPSKTAQRYMGNFISRYQLIERVRHGYYIKIKRQKSNPTEG